MSEKKQVLYDLRTAYSGPFAVEDFYAEVDRWIKEKGFEKEPKKKMEHVTKSGKKIEWVIEAHSHLDNLHHEVIVLRALLDNVKESVIKKDGKNIRYIIEIHSHLNDLYYGVVVLDVLMDKVREAIIKKGGKKLRLHNGDALITIEGFLESHIHGSFYQAKPIYYFIRALVDKFVYMFWSFKWDGTVNSDGRELFKRITSFFNLQKFKYQ